MSGAVMDTAERYREFIACLTTKRSRLYETQVMRIRRLAGAQEAWLEGDIAKMRLVVVATWRAHREHALVDPLWLMLVGGAAGAGRRAANPLRAAGRRHRRAGDAAVAVRAADAVVAVAPAPTYVWNAPQ